MPTGTSGVLGGDDIGEGSLLANAGTTLSVGEDCPSSLVGVCEPSSFTTVPTLPGRGGGPVPPPLPRTLFPLPLSGSPRPLIPLIAPPQTPPLPPSINPRPRPRSPCKPPRTPRPLSTIPTDPPRAPPPRKTDDRPRPRLSIEFGID